MTEATGFEAKTIHRLLISRGGRVQGDDNPLDCETSMVDVLLVQALLKAVPCKAAMLIVGDVDHLPSVGPGQVLADVIQSDAVLVVRLIDPAGGSAATRRHARSSVCLAALGQPAEPEPPRARTARTGGQAHDRGDGVRSEDHPPLAYQQGGAVCVLVGPAINCDDLVI